MLIAPAPCPRPWRTQRQRAGWTWVDLGRCPSIPATGRQPRADASSGAYRGDRVREATPPRGRSGAWEPQTRATRPGSRLTSLSSEESGARVRAIRERSVLLGLEREHPAAVAASGSCGPDLGPAPPAPPPRGRPHLPRCIPQGPGSASRDSAAPPATLRSLCARVRPALCLAVARRRACCLPEATQHPAFPLGPGPTHQHFTAPPAALLLPDTFHCRSIGRPSTPAPGEIPGGISRRAPTDLHHQAASGPAASGCGQQGLCRKVAYHLFSSAAFS